VKMQVENSQLELLGKTVSMLSVDGVQKADSGHPGLPMGAALYTSILWSEFLRFDPSNPRWANRDRFVLSAGHGSMLLYSLLHLFGYDLSIADLKGFRQWGSKTPGHPEFRYTAGVEATTGPLGQGVGNSVGMALSGKMLAARYGQNVFNYRVFALVSDGDMMEGISSEAASLAGHLKLGNLTFLYDDNKICLAGKTEDCFSEDTTARFASYGWHTQSVAFDDVAGIRAALANATEEKDRPSLISVRSIIGFGSPNKADSDSAHGAPLGVDEVALTKQALGWPLEPQFYVPAEVITLCAGLVAKKKQDHQEWKRVWEVYSDANRETAAQFNQQNSTEVPAELRKKLLEGIEHTKPEATRVLSGKAIQVVANHLPRFIGGSADLEPSTKTSINKTTDVQATDFGGRNFRFGVREHAMAAVANGLAYEGYWHPLISTFLVFSDYLRPCLRLAAISKVPTLFVFTHDSIWVGEDGPTHEPIEHIQSLRLIPGLDVFRPADGLEVAVSYLAAIERQDGPTAIICSRQNLPPLERSTTFDASVILKGGYVLKECNRPDVSLVATGSEVALALKVSALLEQERVSARIVSLPCVDRFQSQDKEYRDYVIPDTIPSVTMEAGVTSGWADVVGPVHLAIGIDTYGASAPGEVVAEKLGLNAETVASKVKKFLQMS
jgi:transketolase